MLNYITKSLPSLAMAGLAAIVLTGCANPIDPSTGKRWNRIEWDNNTGQDDKEMVDFGLRMMRQANDNYRTYQR